MSSEQEKYLKYKNKYLRMKKLIGGNPPRFSSNYDLDISNGFCQFINEYVWCYKPGFVDSYISSCFTPYTLKELTKEIKKIILLIMSDDNNMLRIIKWYNSKALLFPQSDRNLLYYVNQLINIFSPIDKIISARLGETNVNKLIILCEYLCYMDRQEDIVNNNLSWFSTPLSKLGSKFFDYKSLNKASIKYLNNNFPRWFSKWEHHTLLGLVIQKYAITNRYDKSNAGAVYNYNI